MTARAVVHRANADGSVEVELDASQACRGCAGTCMWRRLPSVKRAALRGNPSVHVGMPVLVSLPQRFVLLSALLLHGLPWAALLAGALAGVAVSGTDLGCLLGAIAGVASSSLMTPGLRRRLERATMQQVVLQPLR